MDAELAKEVKKLPTVEFMIPKKIFSRVEISTEEKDSLLASLWDFSTR